MRLTVRAVFRCECGPNFKTETMAYGLPRIRQQYGVPAKRGMRVTYQKDQNHAEKAGKITSSDGAYLRIRFDGDIKTYPAPFHPTWNIKYHDETI
jgi:hypothetical protein